MSCLRQICRRHDIDESRDPLNISLQYMREYQYFVYIMASLSGTIYIGVTNNLIRRVYEHKHNLMEGFTKKYQCHKLVYFEQTDNIESAILREKQLKNWNRKKKEFLIKIKNPHWKDLYFDIIN